VEIQLELESGTSDFSFTDAVLAVSDKISPSKVLSGRIRKKKRVTLWVTLISGWLHHPFCQC
jgi:hypothetical protein